MPKPRKSRSHRSEVAANLTGTGSSASGAGPSQMSANSMTINYTAMPTETLRFMLSQRHLNQTGSRRVLITRLQESDSPAANTAPQVPDQLSAMIASIVEVKLANFNSRSASGYYYWKGNKGKEIPCELVGAHLWIVRFFGSTLKMPAKEPNYHWMYFTYNIYRHKWCHIGKERLYHKKLA